jgi:uncharacterized membrane protein YfcA
VIRPAHALVLSVLVGLGFAVTYILRGHVLPGLVGGVLAAIMLYLAIDRFQAQAAAARRRRERSSP